MNSASRLWLPFFARRREDKRKKKSVGSRRKKVVETALVLRSTCYHRFFFRSRHGRPFLRPTQPLSFFSRFDETKFSFRQKSIVWSFASCQRPAVQGSVVGDLFFGVVFAWSAVLPCRTFLNRSLPFSHSQRRLCVFSFPTKERRNHLPSRRFRPSYVSNAKHPFSFSPTKGPVLA